MSDERGSRGRAMTRLISQNFNYIRDLFHREVIAII